MTDAEFKEGIEELLVEHDEAISRKEAADIRKGQRQVRNLAISCVLAFLLVGGAVGAVVVRSIASQAGHEAAVAQTDQQQSDTIKAVQAEIDRVNAQRAAAGEAPIPTPTVAPNVPVNVKQIVALVLAALPAPVAGADGSPGATGPAGATGAAGPTGATGTGVAGPTGATGVGEDGENGTNGKNAPTITSLTVGSDCHLVATLSDGTTIDAGYVCGPAGPTGAAGADAPTITGQTFVLDGSGNCVARTTLSDGTTLPDAPVNQAICVPAAATTTDAAAPG